MNYQIFEMMRSEPFGALQWRNCLGRLGAYSDPIFGRMIFMPLENTITCGDLMEGRDGQDDIFCKKAVSCMLGLEDLGPSSPGSLPKADLAMGDCVLERWSEIVSLPTERAI